MNLPGGRPSGEGTGTERTVEWKISGSSEAISFVVNLEAAKAEPSVSSHTEPFIAMMPMERFALSLNSPVYRESLPNRLPRLFSCSFYPMIKFVCLEEIHVGEMGLRSPCSVLRSARHLAYITCEQENLGCFCYGCYVPM